MIPGSANPLLLKSAAAAAGGYQVSRSLRFNSSDSVFLSKNYSTSPSDNKKITISMWVKRSKLDSGNTWYTLFWGYNGTSSYESLLSFKNDTIYIRHGGSSPVELQTTAVYRDTSAWYHIVLAIDTTQSTSTNRTKLYVNGDQVTTFSTANYPAQNSTLQYLYQNANNGIGAANQYGGYFDGYLADCYIIDGQALTPSSFTEVSATTGQLIPLAYSGSFGTNGFWLKFSDNSAATAATLGKDYSGNSNNWTPNNLSVTAGAGNDSLVDTPTSTGTDTGVGGEVRGNYATWNPLDTISGNTFSNGNLDIQTVTAAYGTCRGTIGVSTGKWYWEINVLDETGGGEIGILDSVSPLPSEPYLAARGYVYFDFGSKGNNSSQTGYGASYTTGDLIGVALDLDTGTLTFYKNGSSQGTAYSGLPSGTVFFPVIADYQSANSSKFALNAGQRPFAYQTPGTNRPAATFLALCDTNLPAPLTAKPNTLMDVSLWTGNGTQTIVSGLQYSPDFVWIKSRSTTAYHMLFDVVRGAQARLHSNTTDQEQTGNNDLTSFNSDGYTLDNNSSPANTDVNGSGITYVGWSWDAGTSTVSNTQGSITSQVRANVSAGFSVITYPGSSSISTVGHGLGVAPGMFIVKRKSDSGYGWIVYHRSLGASNMLALQNTSGAALDFDPWNQTAPTSSVFTVNTTGSGTVNASGASYVCYAWAPVVGYSNGFSYTGNGSTDGVFQYLGFRPRLILLKCSSTTGNWTLLDTAREGYNVDNDPLYPNLSNAEGTTDLLDITSNGFKLRTTDASVNSSGATYIGFAWAENPFQYARAR